MVYGPGTCGPGAFPRQLRLTLAQSKAGWKPPSTRKWPLTASMLVATLPAPSRAGDRVMGDGVMVTAFWAPAADANRGANERATTALTAAAARPRRIRRPAGP